MFHNLQIYPSNWFNCVPNKPKPFEIGSNCMCWAPRARSLSRQNKPPWVHSRRIWKMWSWSEAERNWKWSCRLERAVVDVVNVTICFDLKVELKKRAGNFTFHFNISIHVHFLLAFHRFVGDFDRMMKRWWRVVKEISLTFIIYDAFIIAFGNFPNSCACSIRNHTFFVLLLHFCFRVRVKSSAQFLFFRISMIFSVCFVSRLRRLSSFISDRFLLM